MANADQHLRKAQHNESFFGTFPLEMTPFLDWVVTGVFYAALHYIRALASKHGAVNISSYGDMDKLFDRLSILKQKREVYFDYRQLKDDSRDARYEMKQFSPAEVKSLIDDEFGRIKSFVLPLL